MPDPDYRLSEFGDSYQQLIHDKLTPHLAQIFGYHALLYRPLAKRLCEGALCIRHQVVIDEKGRLVDLRCRFEELPIASDTIDLVVLPNVLQNSSNPHQVLREVERVLIPEGVAIIVGRNPFSWRGMINRYRQWRSNAEIKKHDISRRRIDDWFNLLGFETETQVNLSVTNQKLQNSRLHGWLKMLGNYFCDCFCSYYIIVARKKVSTLTPIRPSWRRNKHLVPPRLAEPSVRSQVDQWFERIYKKAE